MIANAFSKVHGLYHRKDYINQSKRGVKSKRLDCFDIVFETRFDRMGAREAFAYNLKRLRKERGITKKELAERLGVHWNTVNVWEKGQKFPRDETITEIAKILGVKVSELFEPPAPEPFPGFEDVMSLPARERYYTVWQLAARQAGIEVALGAMGDPFFKNQVPRLETEEEVIAAYKEAFTYWKNLTKRLDEELRKRGIRVEGAEDVIEAEAEVVEEKELPEGPRALPEGNESNE